MPLLVAAAVLALAFAAVWLGFVPPPHAHTLIRIRNGTIMVRRGEMRAHARDDVAEILREAGVSNGYIAITSSRWIAFSRSIPSRVHQRLRNVLLNQWS